MAQVTQVQLAAQVQLLPSVWVLTVLLGLAFVPFYDVDVKKQGQAEMGCRKEGPCLPWPTTRGGGVSC